MEASPLVKVTTWHKLIASSRVELRMNSDATAVQNKKRWHWQLLLRVAVAPLLPQGRSRDWKEIHKHGQISDYKVLSIEALWQRKDIMRVRCTNFASTYCQESFQEAFRKSRLLSYITALLGDKYPIAHFYRLTRSWRFMGLFSFTRHTNGHIIIQEGDRWSLFHCAANFIELEPLLQMNFFTSFKYLSENVLTW